MGRQICPDCKHTISSNVRTCPLCGRIFRYHFWELSGDSKGITTLCIVFGSIAAGFILLLLGGSFLSAIMSGF